MRPRLTRSTYWSSSSVRPESLHAPRGGPPRLPRTRTRPPISRRFPLRAGLDQVEIPGRELAAGEAAEEIEPGEVGVGLEAGVQAGLRPFEPSRLDITDGLAGTWPRSGRASSAGRSRNPGSPRAVDGARTPVARSGSDRTRSRADALRLGELPGLSRPDRPSCARQDAFLRWRRVSVRASIGRHSRVS